MKKFVTTIVLLAGAASVYSQGQINSSDYNSPAFNIHIWSPDVNTPGTEFNGNSPASLAGNTAYNGNPDAPVGTSSYTGTLVGGSGSGVTAATGYANGDNFDVELYAAAGTVNSFSLATFTAVQSMGPLGDSSLPANWAGMYQGGGLLTLNGANGTITVPIGGTVTLAIGAWYNDNGTIGSLAAAQAAQGGIFGVSSLGTTVAEGNNITPPTLPGTANGGNPGISSFSLTSATPEPSTIALSVIGASAFLMRLRRKQ
jgi:hypothetical protein